MLTDRMGIAGMAVREIAAAGRLDPATAWERYAELDAWAQWAPLIMDVDADADRLRSGLRGVVRTVAGLGIPFEVEAVDEEQRRWRWSVRFGPVGVALDHEILERPGGGCVAPLRLDGPWPVVTAYAPAAFIALARLVTP